MAIYMVGVVINESYSVALLNHVGSSIRRLALSFREEEEGERRVTM